MTSLPFVRETEQAACGIRWRRDSRGGCDKARGRARGRACPSRRLPAASGRSRRRSRRRPRSPPGGPDALVHVGIAGAQTLPNGSLALGSEAVYCDIHDPQARIPRVERVEPDGGLLAAARRALPQAHVLPIGTTARVGGGVGCEVEAMEGFARPARGRARRRSGAWSCARSRTPSRTATARCGRSTMRLPPSARLWRGTRGARTCLSCRRRCRPIAAPSAS